MDPAERRVVVSNRIRQEFENGKEYYRLEGQMIREPRDLKMRPLSGNLEYHAYNVFRRTLTLSVRRRPKRVALKSDQLC